MTDTHSTLGRYRLYFTACPFISTFHFYVHHQSQRRRIAAKETGIFSNLISMSWEDGNLASWEDYKTCFIGNRALRDCLEPLGSSNTVLGTRQLVLPT